jgi:oligopeptide/dipeptide ABC transporter ATP-binding protein
MELQDRLGTAVVLITHDLGVVAETSERVIVMYGGRKVEEANVNDIFAMPLHPYTQGLLAAVPKLTTLSGKESYSKRLQEIPGIVPALVNLPDACTFAPRCAFATDICRHEYPPYTNISSSHKVACWHVAKVC